MKLSHRIAVLASASLLCLGGSALAPAAAQPSAGAPAASSDRTWMNLQLATQRFAPGAHCEVPTTEGDTMEVDVVAVTDTSARTGRVKYVVSVPWSGVAPLQIGRGEVMVVKVEGTTPTGPVAADRRVPRGAAPYACAWSDWGHAMQLSVAHLQPVRRPTLTTLLAWCDGFASVARCPVELAARR